MVGQSSYYYSGVFCDIPFHKFIEHPIRPYSFVETVVITLEMPTIL
jgi:hypothetical protein